MPEARAGAGRHKAIPTTRQKEKSTMADKNLLAKDGAITTPRYVKDEDGNDASLAVSTTYTGIGTSSPMSSLDIKQANGAVLVRDASGTTAVRAGMDPSTNDGRLILYTGGAANVDIKANGDSYLIGGAVGVGTSSPEAGSTLHVNGVVAISEYLKHAGDSNTYIRFQGDDIQLVAGGRQVLRMDEGADPDILVLGAQSSTMDINLNDVMYVDGSSSCVGIGTTSPASMLETAESFGVKVVSTSSNYTAGHEVVILVDASVGARRVTLPVPSSTAGRIICVKKTDSSAGNPVELYTSSGTIDGSSSQYISAQYGCLQIVSDGSNWHIIGEK
jgi:hypothetical protein